MDAADDFDGTLGDAGRDGVGALLKARRIELGMTHADVANAVKLPPRRIEAMEAERWDELPDGPYLRGFVRNVARVLQLDATTLLDRIDGRAVRRADPESILSTRGPRGTMPRRRGPVDDRHGGRKLVFGAFVFAIVAALIAWSGTESFDHALASGRAYVADRHGSAPVDAGTSTSVVDAPVSASTASDVATANPAVPSAASASPLQAQSQSQSQPSVPSAPPSPASLSAAASSAASSAADDLALVFHFNEDSWVEVKSADGRVLLHRLNSAGSEQKIDGEAPFSLIVGNAKGVALRFRGQPVDLGPYTRDQVARLTLS